MKKRILLSQRSINNGDSGLDAAIFGIVKTFEGVRIRITIEEFKKPISDKIKAYWFTACIPIVQMVLQDWDLEKREFTKDEAHRFIKEFVWEWYTDVPVPSGVMRVILPMPRIPQKEWPEMLRKAQEWAAKAGYQIPDPGEKIPDWVLEAPDWDYKT